MTQTKSQLRRTSQAEKEQRDRESKVRRTSAMDGMPSRPTGTFRPDSELPRFFLTPADLAEMRRRMAESTVRIRMNDGEKQAQYYEDSARACFRHLQAAENIDDMAYHGRMIVQAVRNAKTARHCGWPLPRHLPK